MSAGRGAGLGGFLSRARPIRAAALAVLLTVAALVTAVVASESLSLSASQTADRSLGAADVSMQIGDIRALGDAVGDDDELRGALTAAGASGVRIGYKAFGVASDDAPDATFMLEEDDWRSDPFPKRLSVVEGRLPDAVGEIAVSRALARTLPLGGSASFFRGGATFAVVGIVEDDFARDFAFAIAPSGTWASVRVDPLRAKDEGWIASRTLYWSGLSEDAAAAALAPILAPGQPDGVGRAAVEQQFQTRARTVSLGDSLPIEVLLALVITPLIVGLLGGWIAVRFVHRIRGTMHTIGVPWSRTRLAGLGAVFGAVAVGATGGLAVGALSATLLRLAMNAMRQQVAGDLFALPFVSGAILVGCMVGCAVACLALIPVPARSPRRRRRASRIGYRHVAPAVAVLLVIVAYGAMRSAHVFDEWFLAALVFGLAFVVLAPVVVAFVVGFEFGGPSAVLAVRQFSAGSRIAGMVTVSVGALLLVSFGLSTLFYSAVVDLNASSHSQVPPGQLEVRIPADASVSADDVSQRIQASIGAGAPILLSVVDGSSDFADGSTYVVRSADDLATLIARPLTADEANVLEHGGTMRTQGPDDRVIGFTAASGAELRLPAVVATDLDPSFTRIDGFMLESQLSALSLTTTAPAMRFVGLDAAQEDTARQLPAELGLNRDWFSVYREPADIAEPIGSSVAALSVVLIAALLFMFYANSVATGLRPSVAGLRAVGLRAGWTVRVVAVEVGLVVVPAVVSAAVGVLCGTLLLLRLSTLRISFHVPWNSLALSVLGILIVAVIAVVGSLRRLDPRERMG